MYHHRNHPPRERSHASQRGPGLPPRPLYLIICHVVVVEGGYFGHTVLDSIRHRAFSLKDHLEKRREGLEPGRVGWKCRDSSRPFLRRWGSLLRDVWKRVPRCKNDFILKSRGNWKLIIGPEMTHPQFSWKIWKSAQLVETGVADVDVSTRRSR